MEAGPEPRVTEGSFRKALPRLLEDFGGWTVLCGKQGLGTWSLGSKGGGAGTGLLGLRKDRIWGSFPGLALGDPGA